MHLMYKKRINNNSELNINLTVSNVSYAYTNLCVLTSKTAFELETTVLEVRGYIYHIRIASINL